MKPRDGDAAAEKSKGSGEADQPALGLALALPPRSGVPRVGNLEVSNRFASLATNPRYLGRTTEVSLQRVTRATLAKSQASPSELWVQ